MNKRMEALEAENAKLKSRLAGATTVMACKRCGMGERPRYMVSGLCTACARAYVAKLEALANAAIKFDDRASAEHGCNTDAWPEHRELFEALDACRADIKAANRDGKGA